MYKFSRNRCKHGQLAIATGFTIQLNSTDAAKVNAFVTANWDSDSGAAITTQAVGVSGLL